MTDVTVYTKDGWKVDYHAKALAWVIHEGELKVVVYTHDGDTPWMVPNKQVNIKV